MSKLAKKITARLVEKENPTKLEKKMVGRFAVGKHEHSELWGWNGDKWRKSW